MKEISLVNFNEEQVKLIKSQIAPKATDCELQLFLYQAKRTGLDPLTRQIYAIFRNVKEKEFGKEVWKQKMTIQTSIDGFRVIAERSGDYGGQDEPIFTEESNRLISCKITVYRFRGDTRYPAAVGVAYWSEYAQTDDKGNPTGLWKKMPHTMLSKVAEALALRKAYPQDLSGLYTSDEMNQADEIKVVEPTIIESKEPAKNASGLSSNGDLAKGTDMKETLEQSNKELAERLIKKIKGFGSVAELEGWLEDKNVKSAYNKLAKYDADSMAEVTKAESEFRQEFAEA